jgi:hypothetical protein
MVECPLFSFKFAVIPMMNDKKRPHISMQSDVRANILKVEQ